MVHAKPALPSGHGELLLSPPFEEWAELAEANRRVAQSWDFRIGTTPFADLRDSARCAGVELAEAYCERLGIDARAGDPSGPVVATGHQPELYHTGVWAKVFLLQRLAEMTGATALDIVVDSDGFDRVGVTVPCFGGSQVERCHADLATGGANTCFACTPTPDATVVRNFVSDTSQMLASLPAASAGRHFAEFGEALSAVQPEARNLAELVTAARRRFERPTRTDYLELPVTELAGSDAFLTFVTAIALDAERFAEAYNRELETYREAKGLRTRAQPVPDLEVNETSIELPFWVLQGGRRSSLSVDVGPEGTTLVGNGVRVGLGAGDEAIAAIRSAGACIAPKALVLTMFTRLFLCDLFIHGVGGGGYDQVTDGIIRRYFGVEPPRFVVASLTMFLPLGAHVVTDAEVQSATERLNRFEHNPDALICDVEFDSADERDRALALAREKTELVAAMKEPGADKKSLGTRIREVNAEMRELLAPIGEALAAEKGHLEAQRSASDILTDRTYPFCFWSPEDVADKVR
jgi:hypothetical protein